MLVAIAALAVRPPSFRYVDHRGGLVGIRNVAIRVWCWMEFRLVAYLGWEADQR